MEPQVRAVLTEAVGGEPRAVETQLSRAKALHNEILSQGRLIDNAKDVRPVDSLIGSGCVNSGDIYIFFFLFIIII